MLETYMRMALEQAQMASDAGEIPVGAVVVDGGGEVIARAYNRREGASDPLAHAEILAIRAAAKAREDWRLSGCMLVVTLEPCPMCAGAIIMARIPRVVFGAYDEKMGCCGSVHDLTDGTFGAPVQAIGGVCEEECRGMLQDFFQKRRE